MADTQPKSTQQEGSGGNAPDMTPSDSGQHQGGSPQGVLLGAEIKRLTSEHNLIVDGADERYSPASYDLRLGDEYYQDGKFGTLSQENDTLTVKSNDFVFVSTLEALQMPRNLTGRCYLRRKLANRGAALLSQGQIDPGYKGKIFGLLYNFAQEPIYLRRQDHIFTAEFTYTSHWTDDAWDYSSGVGEYQNSYTLRDFLRKHEGAPLQGGWNAIQVRFDQLEKQLQDAQKHTQDLANQGFRLFGFALAVLGALAVLFAAAGVYIVIKSPGTPTVVIMQPTPVAASQPAATIQVGGPPKPATNVQPAPTQPAS